MNLLALLVIILIAHQVFAQKVGLEMKDGRKIEVSIGGYSEQAMFTPGGTLKLTSIAAAHFPAEVPTDTKLYRLLEAKGVMVDFNYAGGYEPYSSSPDSTRTRKEARSGVGPGSVSAQITDRFSIGFRAGPNTSYINMTEGSVSLGYPALNKDTDVKIGFAMGGYSRLMLSRIISVQPELLYSMQGASYQGNMLTQNYFMLPVLLRIQALPEFAFEIGPQWGWLLSATDNSGDITGEFKGTERGIATGCSLDFPSRFSLNFRAVLGGSQTTNSGLINFLGSVISSSHGYSSRVFQLTVTYRLFAAGEVGKKDR